MEIYICTIFFTLYVYIALWAIYKAFQPKWMQQAVVHIQMWTNRILGHVKTWTYKSVETVAIKTEQLKTWAYERIVLPLYESFKKIRAYVKKS